MIVLGIHFGHGAAAALVVDGRVVAAIEEEKLNRVKGFVGYPFMAVDYVLGQSDVKIGDVDRVAIDAEDLAEFSYCFIHLAKQVFRRGRFRRLVAHLLDQYQYIRPTWDSSAMLARYFGELFESTTGISRERIERVNHHLAHAASAFYCSPWQEAMILTADGKGDGLCGGVFLGRGEKISRIDALPDCYSIGQFYQAVTKFLGYRVNRHEGKITGLAALGDSAKTYPLMWDILGWDGDRMYNRLYESDDLQHNPVNFYECEEVAKSFISTRYVRYLNGDLRKYAVVHQLYQNFLAQNMDDFAAEDLAAGVQRLAEEWIATYMRRFIDRCPGGRLCLAGGVFANVKVNQRIHEMAGVDQLFVQPAMGDAGCALGAALHVAANGEGLRERPALTNVYQGPGYGDDFIESRLRAADLPYRRPTDPDRDIARDLHQGKIVGRYAEHTEWGPRALGNRSILARPTDKKINAELNNRLRRTEFMPFAPAILAEYAGDYLVGYRDGDLAARYMTVTYEICAAKKNADIAAAVHADGTARPQVVHREDNPRLHELIAAYHRLSGIPALVNTSFNMHEEPMVTAPDDAIRAFRVGAVDILYIGPFIVDRLYEGRHAE